MFVDESKPSHQFVDICISKYVAPKGNLNDSYGYQSAHSFLKKLKV